MARIRTHTPVVALPGGRSFYSNPRKCTRSKRAPFTPGLKDALAKQRLARRAEFTSALKDARDVIYKQATQLREVFGGHSADYYVQEILQRGRLERGRREPSRWNTYLRQEIKQRNSGMEMVPYSLSLLNQVPRIGPWAAKAQVEQHRQGCRKAVEPDGSQGKGGGH